MAIISINGFGDTDILSRFIKDWNDSEKTVQKKKDIYIDSPGGYISVFQAIQGMILTCPDRCTLTAVGEIHSAAFELFYSVTCKRSILPFTFGMYHLGYTEISIDESGSAKEGYDNAMMANLKLMKPHTLELCKRIGMNAKEMKEITSGKDVYFHHDRLAYFLKKSI